MYTGDDRSLSMEFIICQKALVFVWSLMAILFFGSAVPQMTSQNYDCSQRLPVITVPHYILPFGDQFGDDQLPIGDNAGIKVQLNTGFPFFQQTFKSLYVNTDGVVSFSSPFPTMTPTRFPLSDQSRQPMLAPYWANVDTSSNNGRVYFRQTTNTYNRQMATNLVLEYGNSFKNIMPDYIASWVMVVTWHNVTFNGGNCTSPVNTFQLLMSTNGRHSFVSYLFGDMTWTTGRTDGGNMVGLGGKQALVGYASGTGSNNYYLPSSLTPLIRGVNHAQSNAGFPGIWTFRVDSNTVQQRGCNTEGSLTILYGAGPVLGGKPFMVSGPCFQSSNIMLCKIGNKTVPGVTLAHGVQCVPPSSYERGEVPVYLSVNNGSTFPFNTTYEYVLTDPTYEVILNDEQRWSTATHRGVIGWNTAVLGAPYIRVEFVIILPTSFDPGTVTTASIIQEAVHLANLNARLIPGRTELPLGLPLITKMPTLTTYGSIRIFDMFRTQRPNRRITLWSRPQWSLWYFNQYLIELIYRQKLNIAVEMTNEAVFIWNGIKQYVQNQTLTSREAIATFIAEGGLSSRQTQIFGTLCQRWADAETKSPADFSNLSPMPCTLAQAEVDARFMIDPYCNKVTTCPYGVTASECYITKFPSLNYHGQRACYDSAGNITQRLDGSFGSVQRFSFADWFLNAFFDERAYFQCCALSSSCEKYLEHRPNSNCDGYTKSSPLAGPVHIMAYPHKGPVLGGNPVDLTYPSPTIQGESGCMFGINYSNIVPGVIIHERKIRCIAPFSPNIGKTIITLFVGAGRFYLANYEYVLNDPLYTVQRVDETSWEQATSEFTIEWKNFSPGLINVDFVGYEPSSIKHSPSRNITPILVKENITSTPGKVRLPIGLPNIIEMPEPTAFGALRIYASDSKEEATRVTLHTEAFWSMWFLHQYLIELTYQKLNNPEKELTAMAENVWSGVKVYIQSIQPSRIAIAEFIQGGGLSPLLDGKFEMHCNDWYRMDKNRPANFSDLPAVPCNVSQATYDSRYLPDPDCNSSSSCRYRGNASQCFLLAKQTPRNHGQRVCYDTNGTLLTGSSASAAGAQRYFHTSWFLNLYQDSQGFFYCCQYINSCYKYNEVRPTNSCTGYIFQGIIETDEEDFPFLLPTIIGALAVVGTLGVLTFIIRS